MPLTSCMQSIYHLGLDSDPLGPDSSSVSSLTVFKALFQLSMAALTDFIGNAKWAGQPRCWSTPFFLCWHGTWFWCPERKGLDPVGQRAAGGYGGGDGLQCTKNNVCPGCDSAHMHNCSMCQSFKVVPDNGSAIHARRSMLYAKATLSAMHTYRVETKASQQAPTHTSISHTFNNFWIDQRMNSEPFMALYKGSWIFMQFVILCTCFFASHFLMHYCLFLGIKLPVDHGLERICETLNNCRWLLVFLHWKLSPWLV